MQKKILTPIKAIRAKCLDCYCGSYEGVRGCHSDDCSLWPYRLGKRPLKQLRDKKTGEQGA